MMTKERREDLEKLADEDSHMCLLRELLNEIDAQEAEVAALRRQVEERGDVVRVDVPDKAECVWIANEAQLITGRSIWPDTVDAVLRVVRSHLVPATPPPDVVAVPREECGWESKDIPGTGVRGWATDCGAAIYPKHRYRPGEDDLNYCQACGKQIALRSGQAPAQRGER